VITVVFVTMNDPIVIPHDNDVLLGRGNFANAHPGNKQFRAYVGIQKEYYAASRKCDKPVFAKMIVNTINNLVPPGRFLRQDNDTEAWIVVDEKKALLKTRQVLREKSSKIPAQRIQPAIRSPVDKPLLAKTIPHSIPSSKMAASTIGKLQSRLAQQLEMAALNRARESPVHGILQHPFVPNQCNSALDIKPTPSSIVSLGEDGISNLIDASSTSKISSMSDLRPTPCNSRAPKAVEENYISDFTDLMLLSIVSSMIKS